MGRLSDADANNMLDVRFGGAATNVPSTYYIALSTTAPTNAGTNVTEPTGGAYARAAVPNNLTNFPAAAGRSKSNGVTVLFPTATADWGTITHFALMDAATGGTMRAWGALTSGQQVSAGATADFPAGALVISSAGS
jgi:hypothetical protein